MALAASSAPPAPLDYTVAYTPLLGTANSLTVPVPACNPGHLLVMTAVAGYPPAGPAVHPLPPAGWMVWQSGARQGVWTKTASAADATPGATVTQGFDGTAPLAAQITSYPAGTIVKFATDPGSAAPTTSYKPVFPSGITASQMVLWCAGARTSLAAPDNESGVASFNLPAAPWVWHVPPIGPSMQNATTAWNMPAAGTAAVLGPQAAQPVTSAANLDHLAGFLVLAITGPAPAWLRVTATGGGGAGQGTALTVKALSGAAANLTGCATATKSHTGSAATADVQVTPAFSGSWVYGASFADNPGAAFTPDAGTTFGQNFLVTPTQPAAYGTFRSGLTTGASPVTVGGSAPSTASGADVAAAEIRAAPAGLAEIATATATGKVPEDYRHPAPGQEAIFTAIPPSGTRLVACLANGYQKPRPWLGQPVMGITDNLGLTWTELARANGTGYAGVWTAVIP